MIKIGDEFDTEAYGKVRVKDIFTSPSTLNRVYQIQDVEDTRIEFLCWGVELTQ